MVAARWLTLTATKPLRVVKCGAMLLVISKLNHHIGRSARLATMGKSKVRVGVVLALVLGLASVAVGCDRYAPVPDAAPRTVAFWNLNYPETATGHFDPVSQPYSSDESTLLGRQVRQMQAAGIQVGVVPWDGPGTHNETTRLPAALQATDHTNFRVTVAYQPEVADDPDVSQLDAAFQSLSASMSSSDWLHIDAKPVVFVPTGSSDGCATNDRWASIAGRTNVYLVEQWFVGAEACVSQPDDYYASDPSAHATVHLPYSYAISPEYWLANDPTPQRSRDLTQWKSDAVAMQASAARWHIITSFNDYEEGTAIEETNEYGNAWMDALERIVMPKCWSADPVPISHVVVISEENKTWSTVGGTQFGSAPYLHSLAVNCRTFADWTEMDTGQNSASQYVGGTTGYKQAAGTDGTVLNDCAPDPVTCRSVADNIFRQVRVAGGTARSFVEGPTTGCSATGNAAKHVPAMYMMGGDDQTYCATEVRPLTELDPNNLPTFAWVTPNLCNDMHNCSVSTGDAWLAQHLEPILDSDAYRSGSVLVEVWFDEDHPVPNLLLNPAFPAGVDTSTAATHLSALRLWEDVLGLPRLGGAANAVDLRSSLQLPTNETALHEYAGMRIMR